MNILFISLLDPSESGSGNQKVTLLSAKYLSSVGIHCFIAYFKDSEYSSSQLVFDAKFKIDYNDLDGFRSFLIDNEISIIHNQCSGFILQMIHVIHRTLLVIRIGKMR